VSDPATIPAVVLGGHGYVAGELLRLLAAHPEFRIAVASSTSQSGQPVAAAFPHLAGALPAGLRFTDQDAFLADPRRHLAGRPAPVLAGAGSRPTISPAGTSGTETGDPVAVFAATPHGETSALLDTTLTTLTHAGYLPRAVDLSADYRFADTARYAAVYGRPHAAPERAVAFACAVPEHHRGPAPEHAAQPGCFTTASVLAAYPLFALGLADGPVFVSAITGSSGSGRAPAPNTHHPERRSTVYAYAPLAHRHEAEMRMLLGRAAGGDEPEVEFVPHSGPFVRGIHATVRVPLRRETTPAALVSAYASFYARDPFLTVSAEPPRLNDVVGTNQCRLGVTARGRTAVVTSVIDNLVKGAAGGAVQWMNRLFGFPDDRGLRVAGLGVY